MKETEKEKELAKLVATLGRQIAAMQPFICMDERCRERKSKAKFCPHCGNVINY